MDIASFDFELPERLIAQTPLSDRTTSRLLVLDKQSGEVSHRHFRQLLDYLQAGDTLVLNDTRVIPARLFGTKEGTGAKVEVLLLKNLGGDKWEALVRPGKKVRRGTVIQFGASSPDADPLLTAIVEQEGDMGERIIRFSYEGIFQQLLDQLGLMPLPPYIRERLEDKERYQTVYARSEGSAAAPTAGLHFTQDLLQEIEQRGITLTYITLHVGLGTFRPVSVDNILDHRMHEEYYEINETAAKQIEAARSRGDRIIAVGTTSSRTLETIARKFGDAKIEPCSGWTDIFIYPGYEFQLVGGLLTNFHLPKSTLIMLVSALAGKERIMEAYREAIREEYRFFSFGDAMLII